MVPIKRHPFTLHLQHTLVFIAYCTVKPTSFYFGAEFTHYFFLTTVLTWVLLLTIHLVTSHWLCAGSPHRHASQTLSIPYHGLKCSFRCTCACVCVWEREGERERERERARERQKYLCTRCIPACERKHEEDCNPSPVINTYIYTQTRVYTI